MRIRKLDPRSSKDVRQFIDFPFQIYQNCQQWVPTLESEIKLVFDHDKHPFYQHSEGDFFVVESEGDTLGKIAVLQNRNYCANHHEQIGFFYYFDVAEDFEAAKLLFNAAMTWCKDKGIKYLYGPRGFLRADGIGMLVEGFNHRSALGIGYNYPYYGKFMDELGFSKESDYFSGYMNCDQRLPEKLHEVAEKVKQRGKFWIKTFKDKAEMREWIPYVEKVHNEAFCNNPGFYPSTEAEFKILAGSIIQIADPKLVKIIMKDQEVAGFIIAYGDISAAIQKVHGRIYPFGWISLLREQKNTKIINLNGLGLLPKYQGLGGNALLYTEVEKTIINSRFEFAEMVQIDERNFKSKSDMETMGVNWYKRHRTYQQDIDNFFK
jgi:hypothetical protein